MKTSSKVGIAFFIIGLAALAYWGWPIIFGRYGGPNEKNASQDQAAKEADENELSDEDNGDMPEEEAPEVIDEDLPQDDQFLQISTQDCNNNCKEYTEKEDLDYCKQVCGLSSVNEKADGCDSLEDLDKDYCYKDLAVSKKDLKICDKIEDSGVKKTCKNRVTEDIIDTP